MMREPTLYISIDRTINLGNYESEKLAIILSHVPFDADDTLLAQMLDTADRGYQMLREEIRGKVDRIRMPKGVNRDAFKASEPVQASEPKITVEVEEDIPGDDILTHLQIFGIEVALPPQEWQSEAITQTNANGDGGGQMLALNSALTAIGFGGHKRHGAVNAILAFWRDDFRPIDSLKDLTKAEAHIVLSWIDQADQEALSNLGKAIKGVAA